MLREHQNEACYGMLMKDGTPYIELRLHLEEPPELFALVSAFTAIGNQYEQYIKESHKNLHGDTRLFVREIRKGSIVLDLIPIILPLIENMDRVLIIDEFVRRYGGMLANYMSGHDEPVPSKSALKDFMGQVGIIATDPNGRSTISSAIYHETKVTKRVEMTFDTSQARTARDTIQRQMAAIDLPAYEMHDRVFMRVFQSNLNDPVVGSHKTGEKAIIADISEKPLALIYETWFSGSFANIPSIPG